MAHQSLEEHPRRAARARHEPLNNNVDGNNRKLEVIRDLANRTVIFENNNINRINLSPTGTRAIIRYNDGREERINLGNGTVIFENDNVNFEDPRLTPENNNSDVSMFQHLATWVRNLNQ